VRKRIKEEEEMWKYLLLFAFVFLKNKASSYRFTKSFKNTSLRARSVGSSSDIRDSRWNTRMYCIGSDGSATTGNEDDSLKEEKLATERALAAARACEAQGLSPGAGLATAEEQADAAYADLINTTMDQQGVDKLSENELSELSKGSTMWESGAKTQRKKGLLADFGNLWGALSGGAHIEKNEFGET
jgi:hypothetical protein